MTRVRRPTALAELGELQRSDLAAVFAAMDGLPVAVRLLDPPLHEFLPDLTDLAVREAAGRLTSEETALLGAARAWSERNPMLGTRGVRLGSPQTADLPDAAQRNAPSPA